MGDRGYVRLNTLVETEQTSPKAIRLWTWSELVTALKECQNSLPNTNNSMFITQRILDCLVEKLALPYGARKSRSSSRNKYSQSPMTWWFEELVFLNIDFLEKLIKTIIATKTSSEISNVTISKFLFYYRKFKVNKTEQIFEKRRITETVISLLTLLDRVSVSFKGLFEVYQSGSRLRVDEKYRRDLVSLIGSKLDQVTLDYLLVPSPRGSDLIYDVDLVLKLLRSFLSNDDRRGLSVSRLKKVGRLIDLYLSEVSLDSDMKYLKFLELVTSLPECARESHDDLYRAIDLYLEVHRELCEEEKTSLCCALNYDKLSTEALKHLAKNTKFPTRISARAFMSQSSKLTSLIRDIYNLKGFDERSLYNWDTSKVFGKGNDNKFEANLEKLVDWNEVELKTQPVSHTSTSRRYLPKVCGC